MGTVSKSVRAAAAFVVSTILADAAVGQAVAVNSPQYVGDTGGAWEDANNWRDANDNPVAPGFTSFVVINNSETPLLNSTSNIIHLNVGATSGLTLAAGSVLNITGATTDLPTNLPADFQFLDNFGTITIEGSSNASAPTQLNFATADTTRTQYLNRGGTFIMTGENAQIVGAIRNVNSTIRGAGQLGLGQHRIENQSLISADRAGLTMTLDAPTPGGFGLTNNGGTIRAENGGRLLLTGAGSGWFDGTGGQFVSNGANSVFSFTADATVRGGTYTSLGGGIFRVDAGQTAHLESPIIDASARFLVDSGGALRFANNTVTNNGVITVGTSTTTTDTVVAPDGTGAQSFAINGTGAIALASDNSRVVSGFLGGPITHATTHTIRGFGQVAGGPFTNNGTIDADTSGKRLVIVANDFTNNNSVKATGGGILQITPVGANRYDQSASGVLRASGAGSTVELANQIRVTGGRIETADGGQVSAGIGAGANSTLIDLTADAAINLAPSSSLVLNGAITNNGTITAPPANVGGSNSVVLLGQGLMLGGDGEIVLQSNATGTSGVQGNLSTNTATFGPQHTLRGAGFFAATGTYNNHGTIRADAPGGTLSVGVNAGGAGFFGLANTGTVEAATGSTLALSGTVTQSGAGTVRASGSGAVVSLRSGLTLSGGALFSENGGVIKATSTDTGIGFNTLTNNADLRIEGTQLRLDANLVNNNLLTISPETTNAGFLVLMSGPHTLSGSGTLKLAATSQAGANVQNGFQQNGQLINALGHTIRGNGFIGTRFNNEGLVHADVAGSGITQNYPFATDGFTQNGTFRASNGATLEAAQAPTNFSGGKLTDGAYEVFDNSTIRLGGVNITNNAAVIVLDGANANFYNSSTGTTSVLAGLNTNTGRLTIRNGKNLSLATLNNTGRLIVGNGSTLTVAGSFTNSGIISGNGTINANVVQTVSFGALAPGNSPGTLTIDGNMSIANDTIYEWELGDGVTDLIDVNGQLSFNDRATLNVLLYGTARPAPGDYELFSFEGAAPVLPQWTINLPNGWASDGVFTSGNSVFLRLTAVPEPSALAAIALSGVAMLRRRRRTA